MPVPTQLTSLPPPLVSGTEDISKACHIWSAVVHIDKIMQKTLVLVGRTLIFRNETTYPSPGGIQPVKGK